MKARKLLRTDLPKKRTSFHSLHIPVLLKGKKRYVCDIPFANEKLCYLENGKGISAQIEDLQLLLDERSSDELKGTIERKQIKQKKFALQIEKLQSDILILKKEIEQSS